MQEESITTDGIITSFDTGGTITSGEGLMAQIEKAGTTTTYTNLSAKTLEEAITTISIDTVGTTLSTSWFGTLSSLFVDGIEYTYDPSTRSYIAARSETKSTIEPSKPVYSYTQDWEKDLYLNKLLNKLKNV